MANPYLNDDGTLIDNWADKLPEGTVEKGSDGKLALGGLATTKDFPSLVKQTIAHEKLVGSSIRLPPKDVDEATRAKFLDDIANKLGRPAKAEDYGLKSEDFSEETLKALAVECHTQRFTPVQAQFVVDKITTLVADFARKMSDAEDLRMQESHRKGLEKFGSDYEAGRELVKRMFQDPQFGGGDEAFAYLEATQRGNDWQLINLLIPVARRLYAEDKTVKAGQMSGTQAASDLTSIYRKVSPELSSKG